jgi:hypothetical protein
MNRPLSNHIEGRQDIAASAIFAPVAVAILNQAAKIF